jgi:hypothetical protein
MSKFTGEIYVLLPLWVNLARLWHTNDQAPVWMLLGSYLFKNNINIQINKFWFNQFFPQLKYWKENKWRYPYEEEILPPDVLQIGVHHKFFLKRKNLTACPTDLRMPCLHNYVNLYLKGQYSSPFPSVYW